MTKKEMFSYRFGETRGGRVPQKSWIWGDVFHGWSLREHTYMMSDDFQQFLTPHPPLIRFCPISVHAPIIWRPILIFEWYEEENGAKYFLNWHSFFNFPEVFTKESHRKSISKRKKFKNLRKKGQKFLKNRTSYFCSPTYPPCPILSQLCLTPPPPLKSDIIYARSPRQKGNWA